jgi:hypothetical protein
MMLSRKRDFPVPHRSLTAPQAAGSVTISPSRNEVRRADPALSFQVSAPGTCAFDVIVATDASLFDPANVHRRTPKNFRSSRQDFQGEAIETEVGFYLLPRAFLRDVVSVEPKPTRLYYIAVAYDDPSAREGRYSVPVEAMATSAPFVSIASDLAAANLSKVLGVAIDRLGTVSASGRVMAVATDFRRMHLPESIGGLPLDRRPHSAAPTHSLPALGSNRPAAPLLNGGASYAPKSHSARMAARPAQNGSVVRHALPPRAPAAAQSTMTRASRSASGFVDDDYACDESFRKPAAAGYRDLDVGLSGRLAYDDGFDEDATDTAAPADAPIPPLDPVPGPMKPANNGATQAPNGTPRPAQKPMTPSADISEEDLLVQAILDEGMSGRYEALSLDGGFRGRFSATDPYYQRAHDGLRLGPHQAMQDTGELGELLALMEAADHAGFAEIFGPDAQALLDVTNAEGPSGLDQPGGRGTRVQPVGGKDLWEDPWVERFRIAARHLPFQAAMRGQIIARRLDPVRYVISALGLENTRGTAMLLAAAIHMGVAGAMALARAAVNPFDTPARLSAALDALGYSDLGAFRAAHRLPPGDVVDDQAHVALLAALRVLGADSPVQVPDGEAIMDALVTAAGPGTVGDALLKLRLSPAFAEPGTGT